MAIFNSFLYVYQAGSQGCHRHRRTGDSLGFSTGESRHDVTAPGRPHPPLPRRWEARGSRKPESHGDGMWYIYIYMSYIYDMINIYIIYILYISGWWFQTWLLFSKIHGIILPIDELVFFRGVGQPPTRLYIYIYDMKNHSWVMECIVWWVFWDMIYSIYILPAVWSGDLSDNGAEPYLKAIVHGEY